MTMWLPHNIMPVMARDKDGQPLMDGVKQLYECDHCGRRVHQRKAMSRRGASGWQHNPRPRR